MRRKTAKPIVEMTKPVRGMITNEQKEQVFLKLVHNVQGTVNDTLARLGYASKLGMSYGKDRDLYEALGYPYILTYERYYARYARQGIARRIVNAYPDATWRGKPELVENDDETDTSFEKEWKELVRKLRVYHYLRRADRLSGIGSYGVLLMGYDDVATADDLKSPVSGAKKLLYLQPYSEPHAEIKKTVEDTKNERYGKPEIYSVQINKDGKSKGLSVDVHYSRILHLAEDTLESDIYGTPRLQSIYNRLQDLETIIGGSAEMFWRGAYPGLSFEADKDTNLSAQDLDDLEDEIKGYVHGINRFLRLQGIKTNQLEPKISAPDKHVLVQLQMISAQTQIPVRILIGSERGELSSTEDKESWNDRVDERRLDYAEPMILRPFVDAQIDNGIIAKVDDYEIRWPDIEAVSEKDMVEIGKGRMTMVKDYLQSGADILMSPVKFFVEFLGWEKKEAEEVVKEAEKQFQEEQDQIREEQRVKEEADRAFEKQTGQKPPVEEE